MFSTIKDLGYKYVPILALSPSEMVAYEELPNKEKDLILPLFPLKGWSSSKELDNSIDRIDKSVGQRPWIADIDGSFLSGNKEFMLTGKYPRPVFEQIAALSDPSNGYDNWFQYVKGLPNSIPVVQLTDLSQLRIQYINLLSLQRGVVLRIPMNDVRASDLQYIVSVVKDFESKDLLVIFDYGDINAEALAFIEQYSLLLRRFYSELKGGLYSVSSTSFPYSFPGTYRGELPIYERRLYRKVLKECEEVDMIYSDRGSTRAGKLTGGAGTPPPRIDYPLRDDWRFIRKEFGDPKNISESEKLRIYREIAREIMTSDYWQNGLRLWGTQMIERTSFGDEYGITSPNRATAVRINIHLYQQLHYNDPLDQLDTDEDWED
ncbi:MAG: beta family protein [Marinobacter sp.]|uniref:beta family protein n=1 Tax=Marinobacter sp. TaxID=50741 RepID=UPI0034A05024